MRKRETRESVDMNGYTRRRNHRGSGRFAWCWIISLLIVTALPAAAQDSAETDEFRAARWMLRDAAVRLDERGMELARERLAALTSDPAHGASAYYEIAVADFLSIVWKQDLASMGRSPDEIAARMQRATEALDEAVQREPNLAEAHALYALCERVWANVTEGEESERHGANALRHMERAEALDGGDPRVLTARSILSLTTPGSDAQREGLAQLDEAVAAYRNGPVGSRDRDADWWTLLGRVLRVRSLAFTSPKEALALARETLTLEPDLELLIPTLPSLERTAAAREAEYEPAAPETIRGLNWMLVAQDSVGDGNAEDLPDGRELWYASEPSGERVWFKFILTAEAPREAFGVNLVVDADDDQRSGRQWWGGNGAFTWDRLVTVWLSRPEEAEEGPYRGTMGVADPSGVSVADFANLASGEIAFTFPRDEHAVAIGVPRSFLGDAREVTLVGAVGSDTSWNDDLPNVGSVRIILDRASP